MNFHIQRAKHYDGIFPAGQQEPAFAEDSFRLVARAFACAKVNA